MRILDCLGAMEPSWVREQMISQILQPVHKEGMVWIILTCLPHSFFNQIPPQPPFAKGGERGIFNPHSAIYIPHSKRGSNSIDSELPVSPDFALGQFPIGDPEDFTKDLLSNLLNGFISSNNLTRIDIHVILHLRIEIGIAGDFNHRSNR